MPKNGSPGVVRNPISNQAQSRVIGSLAHYDMALVEVTLT